MRALAPVALPEGEVAATREPRVQSVAKATSILFAIAQSPNGMKPGEIVAQLGLARQATYHLLHTLVTLGLLTKGPDNRFLLGLRVGALVEAFPRHLAPPERLLPYVRQVSYETGETAYASGWWEGEIVNLAVIRGRNAVQAAEMPHGVHAHAHARASGKLLLALADTVTLERYLKTHPLTARTKRTITDLTKFRRELAKIAERGYALDAQEFADGLHCVAAPVRDGAVPYTIGLSTPTERWMKEGERYLAIIRRVATNGPQ